MQSDSPNYDALADALSVLANPGRLQLMHKLLKPHNLTDIELPARQTVGGAQEGRPMSRQAVRQHLRGLLKIGLVHMTPGTSHAGARQATYSLNSQRLFAVIEEIRKLGHVRAPLAPDAFATTALEPGGSDGGTSPTGPGLLVVHGATEGQRFPLPDASPAKWIVGRRPGLPVCIDWDPYVSATHLVIHAREKGGFELENLATNLNGSTLNFAPLDGEARTPVEHGDVIGVGKTLLVFRER